MNSMAKRRVLAILATVAVMAAGGLLMQRMSLNEDVTALLPDQDPVVSDYRAVIDNFHILDAVFLDVGLWDDRGSESDVEGAADKLYAGLWSSKLFESMTYKVAVGPQLLDKLPLWRPCLLTAEDLQRVNEAAAPEHVRENLEAAKRALSMPFDPVAKRLVTGDPLGMTGLLLGKLRAMSPPVSGVTTDMEGRIWKDHRHVLMIAVPKSAGTDTVGGEELIARLDETIGRVAPASGPVRINYVSGHRAALDNARTIKADVSRTTTAAMVGIAALGLLVFRRKWLVALIFLPPFIGSLVAVVVFGLVYPVISAIMVGCGAALIGNAVDYGIVVLYKLDGQSEEQRQTGSLMRQVYRPLAAASLTTIGALLCLLLASLPGQRQMGMYGAVGVLGTVLYAVFALPALFNLRPAAARRPWVALEEVSQKVLDWRQRHGRAVWLVTAAVAVVCLVGLCRLRFDGDVTKLNHLSPETQAMQERFEEIWGGQPAVQAMVRGTTMEETLQANDRLAARLEELCRNKTISSYASVAPLVPSQKTQLENAARWQEFWSPERRDEVRKVLLEEGAKLKFAPQTFHPFMADLVKAAKPFDPDELKETGLGDLINGYITSKSRGAMILTIIYLENMSELPAVQAAIKPTGAVLLSRQAFVQHIVDLVRREAALIAAAASVVVLLLLWLLFGRADIVAAVFLPVVLAVVVTLGILGVCGIPLNMMSCLFIVFVLGTGIDYAILLMNQSLSSRWGRGGTMANTLGAVSLVAATTIIGFAAMILASHPALFSLGLAGTIGIAASLLGAIVVVPGAARVLLSDPKQDWLVWLRSLTAGVLVISYFCLAGVLYVTVVRWPLYLWYRGRREERQAATRRLIRSTARFFHQACPSFRRRHLMRGVTAEALAKPAVIVANHMTVMDLGLLLTLPGDVVITVASWVWDAWIMGRVVRDAGYIRLAPGDFDGFVEEGEACLKRGVSVLVFPEGTRSRDGQIHRFRLGAFELAIRAGADIVPVLLTNTGERNPYNTLEMHKRTCLMRVLPRVTPGNADYGAGAKTLGDHVRGLLLAQQPRDWRLVCRSKVFWSEILNYYHHAGPYVTRYLSGKVRHDRLLWHINALVPRQGTVVDAGCGYGLMSHSLARRSPGRQVIGLDFSAERMGVACGTAGATGNLKFEQRDLRGPAWPEADAVVLIDVLHYWTQDEQRELIERASASLRPGGRLVFRDGCNEAAVEGRRLVQWSEWLARWVGHSPAGSGLFFCNKDFYVSEFAQRGVRLVRVASELGTGYNLTMIFEKDQG